MLKHRLTASVCRSSNDLLSTTLWSPWLPGIPLDGPTNSTSPAKRPTRKLAVMQGAPSPKNPRIDHTSPQIPLFYRIIYHDAARTEGFDLPQNLGDVITGKTEHNFDGVRSLLNDKVSLRSYSTGKCPVQQRMSWQEMEYLLSQTGGSIQCPLNYYRTTKLRFEEEQAGRFTTSPAIRQKSIPLHQLPISRSHTRGAYQFSTSGEPTTRQARNHFLGLCARFYLGERSSLTKASDTGSCWRRRMR